MAISKLKFKYTLDGSAPTTKYIPVYGSTSLAKGVLVTVSGGYLVAAIDGGTHIIGVTEAIADNSGSTRNGNITCPVNVNLKSVYEGNTDVDSSWTYFGTRCELDTGTTLDPSDSTDPIVMCLGPVGAAADKIQEFVILDYSGIV